MTKQIFLIVDESTLSGTQYLNIITGSLETPHVSYLYDCQPLKCAPNSNIIAQAVDDAVRDLGINRFWNLGITFEFLLIEKVRTNFLGCCLTGTAIVFLQHPVVEFNFYKHWLIFTHKRTGNLVCNTINCEVVDDVEVCVIKSETLNFKIYVWHKLKSIKIFLHKFFHEKQ